MQKLKIYSVAFVKTLVLFASCVESVAVIKVLNANSSNFLSKLSQVFLDSSLVS